jgi:hypothetical protein
LKRMRRMTQQRRLLSLGLTGAALLLWAQPGAAISFPPVIVTDEELARKPLIVVARWPKARRSDHGRGEVHTELIVERVLKGSISPGRHQLRVGVSVSWQADGMGLIDQSSGFMRLGSEYNVTKPTLWFLSRERSWNPKDKTLYLSLDTGYGVQPLALEPFYTALLGETPHQRAAEFLQAESPEIVLRALDYVNGGATPWPFQRWQPWYAHYKPKPPRRLVQHAPAVAKVLERQEAELRSYAAAVYAELAGRQSVPRLRSLLADKDPEVRAVAVGVLARHRDSTSVGLFSQAVLGIKGAHLGCEVVGRLAGWGNPQVVPALINFLENDDYAGSLGMVDIRIPALKAQEALRRITGFSFPYDARASQRAWADAQQFLTTQQRAESLREALADSAIPPDASATRTKAHVWFKVTNRSKRTIHLTRRPFDIELRWDDALSGGPGGSGEVKGRGSFLRLAPGESVRWREAVAGSGRLEQVTLLYARHGHEYGVNGWIGVVRATVKPARRQRSRYTARAFSE